MDFQIIQSPTSIMEIDEEAFNENEDEDNIN